jgi:hypothetical protein
MSTAELVSMLQNGPQVTEVGFYDGEGHWCKIEASRLAKVDEANWTPMGLEKQTGELRTILELY